MDSGVAHLVKGDGFDKEFAELMQHEGLDMDKFVDFFPSPRPEEKAVDKAEEKEEEKEEAAEELSTTTAVSSETEENQAEKNQAEKDQT